VIVAVVLVMAYVDFWESIRKRNNK
jgi:hypothetical protein